MAQWVGPALRSRRPDLVTISLSRIPFPWHIWNQPESAGWHEYSCRYCISSPPLKSVAPPKIWSPKGNMPAPSYLHRAQREACFFSAMPDGVPDKCCEGLGLVELCIVNCAQTPFPPTSWHRASNCSPLQVYETSTRLGGFVPLCYYLSPPVSCEHRGQQRGMHSPSMPFPRPNGAGTQRFRRLS